MKRLLACLVALMLMLLPCAAMAEEYALYASEHGYTIALPDASWFRLDGQTYAQYQATHGETFAEMTIRDADTAQSYADKGTGSVERNIVLSKNRARVVYECLVNEFGVPKRQLRVDHKGGVDNMFYNDPRMSRAVITKVMEEEVAQ